MSSLSSIPATASLLLVYFDRRAGRLQKAKARIDRIKTKYPQVFEFLDAYHGFILINERDIEGALKLFDSNIRSLPEKKDENQRYIELFCRYFLDAGSEDFGWEQIISEAHQLKPDALTKIMLTLPTKDQVISSIGP